MLATSMEHAWIRQDAFLTPLGALLSSSLHSPADAAPMQSLQTQDAGEGPPAQRLQHGRRACAPSWIERGDRPSAAPCSTLLEHDVVVSRLQSFTRTSRLAAPAAQGTLCREPADQQGDRPPGRDVSARWTTTTTGSAAPPWFRV